MTVDEDGEMEMSKESEASKAPVTPNHKPSRGKGKTLRTPRTNQTWVPKRQRSSY